MQCQIYARTAIGDSAWPDAVATRYDGFGPHTRVEACRPPLKSVSRWLQAHVASERAHRTAHRPAISAFLQLSSLTSVFARIDDRLAEAGCLGRDWRLE